MIYKAFKELQLSTLGMGNMRLPVKDGAIDQEKAREMIEHAYESGINYFDTAFRYHGGESELFVGKVLAQYPRETWYLASKMPGHMMQYTNGKLGFQGYLANEKIDSIGDIFESQLARCGVTYFDFYLLHNLCETSYDFYTNRELGVVAYLLEQKRLGRIRHLGFSAHGRADTIENFLKEFPDTFEFVQIQLNYMDWVLQQADQKYQVLTQYNLPIVVMEPCRGGRLASLPEGVSSLLKNARPEDSIASWAFRFLQSLPNVLVVLSGMTTPEQLDDNIAVFSKEDGVTPEEQMLLDQVVTALADLVPCTACRYCCEDCPQGLDIPKLINMYNDYKFTGAMSILNFTLGAMDESALPGACIGCGACSAACPQSLDIPAVMQAFDAVIRANQK